MLTIPPSLTEVLVKTANATWWVVAAGLVTGAATAQTPEGGGLEEIVVTAQRREEKLQQTPVTLTALTADQVQRLGITSTQDIAKAVPNLQMLPLTANPSTFQIGLRGGVEQTGGLIVSEPVVGLYVDDVYRGRLQGANMQLSDLERIEVLRGPQGTLYGRNTFSGAIKLVTRTPSADKKWFDASVGRGSFSEWNVQGSAGGGLTDTLGGSIALLYRNQADGWIFNRAQNRAIGAEKNLALRTKLAYAEGPWRASLALSYGKDDNDGYIPTAIRFEPPTVPTNRATHVTTDQVRPRFGTDPYVAEYPQPSAGHTKTSTATVDLSYKFDKFDIRSITGYVHLDDFFRWDIAAGVSPMPGVYTPSFDRQSDATAKQITQELQASGRALDARLDWIVGLYYFNEKGDQALTDNIPLFFLFNLAPTFLSMNTDSYALFGQTSYKVTDRFSLTVGARTSKDEKRFSGNIQSGFGNPVPRTQVDLSRSFSSTTPKLGADFKFSDTIFGYLSASKGFKAGGFNGLAVLNPTVLRAVYEPQNVKTYEAGIKADWLGRRLRTNVTVFYNDITELQQTAQLGAGSFAIQNVGDATVKGLEAEISVQPIDGLNFFANIGLQDGKYDRLSPTAQAAQAGGTDLPLVAAWSSQIGFSWEVPVTDRWIFRVGADAHSISDHYLEVTNSIQVKGNTRLDGFVGAMSADRHLQIDVQGRNLTDEVNYETGFVSSTSPALATLRPRQWMLNVKYKMQ